MKKLVKNIKNHKVITSVVVGCFALALVGVGFFCYQNAKKISNSQKAMELAAREGGVTSEELAELEADGGYAEFGTEITDPNTGETVVLTQDENGNIVRTVTRDSAGNSTGATIPEYHSQGGGNSDSPSPQPSGHNHSWVAQYTTVQVPHTQVIHHPAITHQESWWHCKCGSEGKNGDGSHTAHQNTGCRQSYGNYGKTITDHAEWNETVTTYTTEQQLVGYVCSECGARQ